VNDLEGRLGHRIAAVQWAIHHFLLVVCIVTTPSNTVPDIITTFTVYVTVCDLEKSSFSKKLKL